jgi:hypothetical protein
MSYADDIHFATKDADLRRGIQHRRERNYTYRPGCQCAACRAKEIENTMPTDMAVDKMQCNGGKTVHVEFEPETARKTAFEILGNNTNQTWRSSSEEEMPSRHSREEEIQWL